MKKRIIIISISATLVVAIVIALICLAPLIRLKKYMNTLEKKQYAFNCEYYAEINGNSKNSISGTIEGYRDNPYTYGKVYIDDNKLTTVYVEDGGDILINLKPVIMQMIEEVAPDDTKWHMLKYTVKNTYVSLDQCSDVMDTDFQGMIDEATECKYSVKKLSNPPETKSIDLDDLNKVQAYKITTDTDIEEIIIVLGVNSDGETIGSVIIDDKMIYLEAQLEYDTGKTDEISMPEESFSEYEIGIFKTLLKMFK